ncbi:MAG: hypothetical protein ACKESB_02930 [Candidatus Hodgkinia cicadicola]
MACQTRGTWQALAASADSCSKRYTSVVGQICEPQSSGTSTDVNFSVSTATSHSLTCF